MEESTLRSYPDWHRMVPEKFRRVEWAEKDKLFFYYNCDWESFLFYCMILTNKDYIVAGGAPDWLRAYLDRMEMLPFAAPGDRRIALTFSKDNWVTNELVFYLDDQRRADGFCYSLSSHIIPSDAFLRGDAAPGRAACPKDVWLPYLLAGNDRIFHETEWRPE